MQYIFQYNIYLQAYMNARIIIFILQLNMSINYQIIKKRPVLDLFYPFSSTDEHMANRNHQHPY